MDQEQPDNLPDSGAAATPAPLTIFDEPTLPSGDDADLPEGQTTAEDDAEDEIDGVKLRGKKEVLERIKSERLMQADYTRKTQEVAEQRRAFDAERVQQQQLAQNHLREVAQIVAIDERLAQFRQVDWQALSDSDPVQAQKLHFEYQQLQGNRAQLAGELTQKQQQSAMEQQQSHAKQLQEAQAVVAREIKGWSPELASKLTEYGQAQGFPREVLAGVTQPAFVKVLHRAYLYDQMMAQRTAKPAATPPPAPPTRIGGGGATSTKKLSDMSDREYAEARRQYIAKNR